MPRFPTIASLLLLLSASTTTSAFLFKGPAVHPNLKEFANAQKEKLLNIRLDIMEHKDRAAFSLQGPMVRFMDSVAKTVVAMPVAGGPDKALSSGSKELDIVKDGHVIDLSGLRSIPFKDGTWEMAWKDGHTNGMVICSFDLPETVTRNDNKVDPCRIFIEFPIWTTQGLQEDRAYKNLMEERRQANEAERMDLLMQYREESNLFKKAQLYHAALTALERNTLIPKCHHVPEDGGIVNLNQDLVLAKKGTVWMKSNKTNKNVGALTKLGFASVSLCDDSAEEE